MASTGETLQHVRVERGPLRIEAMLAAPERARSGATGLALLVNGRPVRDRQLARAVAHAYGSVMESGRYPVGVVWIDLSKDHYGIHGTPEPAAVGKTASHGCVRLTNWDALKLAGLISPGTRVIFQP